MHTSKFSSLFILTVCVSVFSNIISTRVELAGTNWSISNGAGLQANATVPGTIHTILFLAKLIDEPYWRFHDTDLRYLINQSWTFAKTFSLQSEVLDSTQFTLHFDQVDTVSNITLNGCFLGNTNSMFFAYTFNVSRLCLQSENTLRVEFMSPIIYAHEQSIAYNISVGEVCPNSVQHGECNVQFIRKEPCSFSWDWGPAFAPIGITGDVYIEALTTSTQPLKLDSVNVITQSSTAKQWQVDVQLSGGDSATTYTLDFQLQNTSWSFTTSIKFNQNTTVSLSISNENVELWWPNGHGNQPLYQLTVSSRNEIVGSRLIGFRTVELVQQSYGPNITGLSFYFRINSRAIFVKGSNWIPPDSFQERVTDERLERLLTSAKIAGMNMLRIWGGGIYERDSFYEIADRLGIMLWHDFMFAGRFCPVNKAFLLTVRTEIIYQVQRLQSHPSIVLWAGNNENEVHLASFVQKLSPTEAARFQEDYRILYINTIMATLNEIDPHGSRPFVPSSPSNGIESAQENYTAKNPNNPLYGDVHFYNYQIDSWNGKNYPITRFLSETGVESMPNLKTWRQSTNFTEDLRYTSDFVVNRDHHPDGQHQMVLEVQFNLPLPVTNDPLKNFTQLSYLTQVNQAMTYKTVSDHCRYYSPVGMINPNTSQGNTMGLMYWQLDDIWQAPTWATIEYDLTWKMAHYYVRHMYSSIYILLRSSPYLPSVNDMNAEVLIYLVSDLVNTTHNIVNCSIKSYDSFETRYSFGYDVTMHDAALMILGTWNYQILMERAHCSNSTQCLMLCSLHSDDQQATEVQSIFFARPKDIQLYNPNVRIVSVQQRSLTEVDVIINADKPGLFVWIEIPEGVSGYLNRNGFHMFEQQVTVTFTSWTSLTKFNYRNSDFGITSLYDVTQP